jgi:RimJ/RimL family protein N-acetyltransferase
VRNLERVYAEVYGFNQHSLRLMERIGFQKEGVLRQHEIHNGARQDMHFFGILKAEFYQKYETIFKLPDNNEDDTGKI